MHDGVLHGYNSISFFGFLPSIHTQLTTCGIPLVVQRFSYVPYRMRDIAIHRGKGEEKVDISLGMSASTCSSNDRQ